MSDLRLARGLGGRVLHWWRPVPRMWSPIWLPLCRGAQWQTDSWLQPGNGERICPRCARLVPDTPLLEVEP